MHSTGNHSLVLLFVSVISFVILLHVLYCFFWGGGAGGLSLSPFFYLRGHRIIRIWISNFFFFSHVYFRLFSICFLSCFLSFGHIHSLSFFLVFLLLKIHFFLFSFFVFFRIRSFFPLFSSPVLPSYFFSPPIFYFFIFLLFSLIHYYFFHCPNHLSPWVVCHWDSFALGATFPVTRPLNTQLWC